MHTYVCSNEWETLAKTPASLPCSSMPMRAHCLAKAPLRGDSVLILVVGLVYWILVFMLVAHVLDGERTDTYISYHSGPGCSD
jgi:hypothetical protein